MEIKWLDWAKQLQSIAQVGLTYSKDEYDLERFELIRQISIEMLSEKTGLGKGEIKNLFANETGYATPKVDIRAVVFRDNKILMVREKMEGDWSLPAWGGGVVIWLGVVEVGAAKEESGFDVKFTKLLAVLDKKCHPHPPSPFHVYKMFIQCEIIGGHAMTGIETSEVAFFSENELPPLSVERNTKTQIEMAFQSLNNTQEFVYLD